MLVGWNWDKVERQILSKPQPNLNTTVGFDMKMTVQTSPTHHHRNSISAISQLLLTQFWWNFKGRFLWTSRTNYNCNGDICPGNICPRNICPYQEYLRTWFWWNFKDRFLGTSQTDSNSHVDICPGNIICSGDICTYQELTKFLWNFKGRF